MRCASVRECRLSDFSAEPHPAHSHAVEPMPRAASFLVRRQFSPPQARAPCGREVTARRRGRDLLGGGGACCHVRQDPVAAPVAAPFTLSGISGTTDPLNHAGSAQPWCIRWPAWTRTLACLARTKALALVEALGRPPSSLRSGARLGTNGHKRRGRACAGYRGRNKKPR